MVRAPSFCNTRSFQSGTFLSYVCSPGRGHLKGGALKKAGISGTSSKLVAALRAAADINVVGSCGNSVDQGKLAHGRARPSKFGGRSSMRASFRVEHRRSCSCRTGRLYTGSSWTTASCC